MWATKLFVYFGSSLGEALRQNIDQRFRKKQIQQNPKARIQNYGTNNNNINNISVPVT